MGKGGRGEEEGRKRGGRGDEDRRKRGREEGGITQVSTEPRAWTSKETH